jgi:hypothetical protein
MPNLFDEPAQQTYYGNDAVRKVEELEGRTLSPMEQRVVVEEGYVDGLYSDSKGIPTRGVGQTGEYADKSFSETFSAHVDRARDRITNFDSLPEYLRAELVQSEYRGGLGKSPEAVELLNAGKPMEAAAEFLNNKEYLDPNTPDSIKQRMESVAEALKDYATDNGMSDPQTSTNIFDQIGPAPTSNIFDSIPQGGNIFGVERGADLEGYTFPVGRFEAGMHQTASLVADGIASVMQAAELEPLESLTEFADKHGNIAAGADVETIWDQVVMASGQLVAPVAAGVMGAIVAPLVGASAVFGTTASAGLMSLGMTLGDQQKKAEQLSSDTGQGEHIAGWDQIAWSTLLTAPDMFGIGRARLLAAPLAEVVEGSVKKGMRVASGASGIAASIAKDSAKVGLAEGVQDLGTGLGANYFTDTAIDESRMKSLSSSFVDEMVVGTILGVPLSSASLATRRVGEAQADFDANRKMALEKEFMSQLEWENEIDPATGKKFPERAGRKKGDIQDAEGNFNEDAMVQYIGMEGAANQPSNFNLAYNPLTGTATDRLRDKFWDNQAMQVLTQQFNLRKGDRLKGATTINENAQMLYAEYNGAGAGFFNASPAEQGAAWEARAKGENLDTTAGRSLDAVLDKYVPEMVQKASRDKLGKEGLFKESSYLPIALSLDWGKIAEDPATSIRTMQEKMVEQGKSEGQIKKATKILEKKINDYKLRGNEFHYGMDRATPRMQNALIRELEKGPSKKGKRTVENIINRLKSKKEGKKRESPISLDRALEDVPQEWFEGYRNEKTPHEILKQHGKMSTEHAALMDKFGHDLSGFDAMVARAILEGEESGKPLEAQDIEKMYDVLRTQQRIHLRPINQKWRERQQRARSALTIVTLGMSALVSIPEALSISLNTDMRSALRGIASTVGRNKNNYIAASDIGLAYTDAMNHVVNRTGEESFEIGDIESNWIKYATGLPQMQNFLTTWAAKSADIHMRRMLAEINDPSISTAMKNRHYLKLAEAGIDPSQAENLRASGFNQTHPYFKEYQKHIAALVGDTIVDPSPVDKPLWMNDERFLLISQLKGFMVSFTNRVMRGTADRVGMESGSKAAAMRTTMGRIAPYVAMYLVGQVGVGFLKEFIKTGTYDDEKDVTQRVTQAFAYLGSVAYFLDPLQAGRHGSDPITAVAGPAYSIANNTLKGTLRAMESENPDVTMAKTLFRLVPNVPGKGYVKDLMIEAME